MTAAPTETRSNEMPSTWALSRVEGRRLVTHPAVLIGFAFGLVSLVINRLAESDLPVGTDLVRLAPLFLAVGTFIAANLSALRDRRHGTEELYESEPLSARQRTAGHLLSVLWAAGLAAILIATIVVTLAITDGMDVGFVDGSRPRIPTLVEMAQGPIVVLLFGVVGVTAARWIPNVAVALLAFAAAIPYLMVEAWTVAEGPDGWYTPLWSAAREVGGVDTSGGDWYPLVVGFAVAALAWHLLFLIGVIVIASALALAKQGWTRRLVVAAAVGAGAAVIGGAMQVAAATPWP